MYFTYFSESPGGISHVLLFWSAAFSALAHSTVTTSAWSSAVCSRHLCHFWVPLLMHQSPRKVIVLWHSRQTLLFLYGLLFSTSTKNMLFILQGAQSLEEFWWNYCLFYSHPLSIEIGYEFKGEDLPESSKISSNKWNLCSDHSFLQHLRLCNQAKVSHLMFPFGSLLSWAAHLSINQPSRPM